MPNKIFRSFDMFKCRSGVVFTGFLHNEGQSYGKGSRTLYVQAMDVVAIQDCHRPYLQCSTRPCSISISRAANSSLQSPLTHTLRCGVATAIRLLFPPPFPIA